MKITENISFMSFNTQSSDFGLLSPPSVEGFWPYGCNIGHMPMQHMPFPFLFQDPPFVFNAQMTRAPDERFQGPPLSSSYRKAYEWYKVEHAHVPHSGTKEGETFAQWLDKKYGEYLNRPKPGASSNGCSNADDAAAAHRNTASAPVRLSRSAANTESDKHEAKRFRLRSPWRKRKQEESTAKSLDDKTRSRSKSCEYILRPRSSGQSKETSGGGGGYREQLESGQSRTTILMSRKCRIKKNFLEFCKPKTKSQSLPETDSEEPESSSDSTISGDKIKQFTVIKSVSSKETLEIKSKCCPCRENILAKANLDKDPLECPCMKNDPTILHLPCPHKGCPHYIKQMEKKTGNKVDCLCYPEPEPEKEKKCKKACFLSKCCGGDDPLKTVVSTVQTSEVVQSSAFLYKKAADGNRPKTTIGYVQTSDMELQLNEQNGFPNRIYMMKIIP